MDLLIFDLWQSNCAMILLSTSQIAAEHVLVLNSVNRALPFPVTTADDVKDVITEEIRLRYFI